MNSPTESPEPDPKHEALIARALTNAEVQARLDAMEGSIKRLDTNLLDRHTKQITWIFSIFGLFVTGLGIWSKIDTREATRDMENRVDKATTEMQGRFEVLSGEERKKPVIQIFA